MNPAAEGPAVQSQPLKSYPTTTNVGGFCTICRGDLLSNGAPGIRICGHCLFGLTLESADPGAHQMAEERRLATQGVPMFGSYELLEEIGRGGQGVVFRAVHRDTNEFVAVKTVLPHEAGCSETLLRFQREAAAAQSLDHPHTMPVHEVGCSAEGVPFFSMKLALGGNLHQLGAKYRGRWRQIAGVLVKISEAVQHAHERGILHRDLKPGNILFTEDQEPLVTDFGLAKELIGATSLTESCAVLGTPNYVSPEQAAGRTKDLDATSDVYSLGTIFFELLTGRPPFTGDNPLDVLRQVAEQTPPRPRRLDPLVPKALDSICMRCLERKPADRYQSAQELADDLERWSQGRPIAARPALEQVWRAIKSQPEKSAWCGAVMVFAVVGWCIWIAAGRINQPPPAALAIAVVIENPLQDPDLSSLVQSTTDQLRRDLSERRMLQVRNAETVNLPDNDQIFDPIVYGRSADARVVLDGFVRRAGGQIRLVTRLLRCDTGEIVWRHVDFLPLREPSLHLRSLEEKIVSDLQARWSPKTGTLGGKTPHRPTGESQLLYTRGMELAAHSNQHDLTAAIELFRKASDADPHFAAPRAMSAFALWTLAEGSQEWDRLPLALSSARAALALDPDSAQAHRVVASCYQSSGRNTEALEELWKAVEISPQSAGCCVSLAICLRAMGDLDQALPWMTRAIRLEPARGTLYATLGETLALRGQDTQAEVSLRRAIELDSGQSELQFDLGVLRIWQQRFEEARQLCTRTRAQFPDSRFGLSLAAWIEFCDGNQRDATTFFEKLRSDKSYQRNWKFYGAVNPSSALAYLAKQAGFMERAHSLTEEALAIDRELLVKYPHNPRLLHDIAATFSTCGDAENAWHYLQESISAGWVEYRSTEIDPRFSGVIGLARFKELLSRAAGPS